MISRRPQRVVEKWCGRSRTLHSLPASSWSLVRSPGRTVSTSTRSPFMIAWRRRANSAVKQRNEEALPADLAGMRAEGLGPWSAEALEEDARRLAEFERTRMGVPFDEAKAWTESWGTPNELPPPKPRKL